MKFTLIVLLAVQAADWSLADDLRIDPLAGCDTVLTDEFGVITSPNFPNNYGPNLNCSWLMFGSSGKVIQLTFNSFLLETNQDIVKVYDGPSTSNTLLLVHSGYVLPSPNPVISTANAMLVTMTSNAAMQYSGFRADYASVIATTTTGLPTDPPPIKCGGELLGGGTFSPPTEEGSNLYANNLNCTWRLESSSPNKIGIEFKDFETEPKVDYVKVWKGWDPIGEAVVTLTGKPENTTFNFNDVDKLTVLFFSDESVNMPAFEAHFSSEITATTSSTAGTETTTGGTTGTPDPTATTGATTATPDPTATTGATTATPDPTATTGATTVPTEPTATTEPSTTPTAGPALFHKSK